MVTTLLFAQPYTTENPSRVSVPHTSPALRGQSKSNCPAPYPGYSTASPVGGAVDTKDWYIILLKYCINKANNSKWSCIFLT